jgi:hypothetical protein
MKQAVLFLFVFTTFNNIYSQTQQNKFNSTDKAGAGTTSPQDIFEVYDPVSKGSTRFGGTNGRTLSAYVDGVKANFDFDAVSTYYSGNLLVNGSLSSPWGSSQDLVITTSNPNNKIAIDRQLHNLSAGGFSSGVSITSTAANEYSNVSLFNNTNSIAQLVLTGSGYAKGNIWRGNEASFYSHGTGGLSLVASDASGILRFGTGGLLTSNERMRITADGNVAIGTLDPQGYRLAVNGDAIFTKVKVKQYSTWPDYVFNDGYKLLPLTEVEKFIKQNHHLPEVPNAAEVEKNGLDLGDNQATLLKKIEELTLYIIDINKKMDEQRKVIIIQNDQINKHGLLIKELSRKIP